jgi:hypothetical protein
MAVVLLLMIVVVVIVSEKWRVDVRIERYECPDGN